VSSQPTPELSSTPEQSVTLRPVPRLALASARGGGGSPLPKVLIAAVIVTIAIGSYFYFGAIPPAAVGEITHLTAYPIHRDSKGEKAADPDAAKAENAFDEIIVIVELRLRNQTSGPIFLSDMSALLNLPTEEHRSLAATTADYDRVFIAYPELAPMKREPLLRDITIPAGATAEGQLIFNYPITKDQWDMRRSLDLTISFLHQKDIILPAPQ
jgi:hypothetical protein